MRGRGLLVAAELDRPVEPVLAAALERGLVVGSAGANVLRLTPPLTIGPEEIGIGMERLAKVLS